VCADGGSRYNSPMIIGKVKPILSGWTPCNRRCCRPRRIRRPPITYYLKEKITP
jgi:hypothetical protein